MSTTLDDVRARVQEAGHSLEHVDDRELLMRLDAMPAEAADDFDLACTWLVSAFINPYPKVATP